MLPNENEFAPDENQKAGDLTWRRVTVDTAWLDFCEILGVRHATAAVAYAHAYLHCDTDETFLANFEGSKQSKVKVVVNGTQFVSCQHWHTGLRRGLRLAKGWNRLLLRISCGLNPEIGAERKEASWYDRPLLHGSEGCAYESRNIRWATLLPGWSIASPIVVGDRVFANADQRTLCCLDKNDGRILWTRTTTFHDAATPEERKAHPEVFQEVDPLAARLREIDAAPSTEPAPMKEKTKLEKVIARLMSRVDPEKYDATLGTGEPGASVPTPTSDGRRVYANFHPCVTSCFDMEGKRLWTYVHPVLVNDEHGRVSSPHLVDGKLLVHADQLVALDAVTGKPVWQMPREYADYQPDWPKEKKIYNYWHGYLYRTSFLDRTLGGQSLVITPDNVLRAADGHILGDMHEFAHIFIPTPVVDGRRLYRLLNKKVPGFTELDTFELPPDPPEPFQVKHVHRLVIDAVRFPRNFYGAYYSSPVYHEGLLYCVNADGVLSVVDVTAFHVVCQKLLDLDWMFAKGPAQVGCGASLALGGKHIYVFGNHGTCLVLRPGRRYEQVAKNRIVRISDLEGSVSRGWPEQTLSSPVFEGNRLYCRTTDRLYCIEEGAE